MRAGLFAGAFVAVAALGLACGRAGDGGASPRVRALDRAGAIPQSAARPVAQGLEQGESSLDIAASRPVAIPFEAAAPFSEPVDHWLPGPRRPGLPSDARRAELEQGCRACHEDHSAQWAHSQHATAWTDPLFQHAYAVEPLAFCQGCHAPEVAADEPVPSWAADIGVGCVTCHVEPGRERVWSAGPRAELDAADSPCAHPVSRSPAFASTSACAACHEFDFPDAALRERPLAMQSTVREHARSAAADRSCGDCHMPELGADGRRHSHRFPGADDDAMLRRALKVEARRSRDAVELVLRPGRVGHAVPTGDLLRRLELRVLPLDAEAGARPLVRRWLGRRFAPVHEGGLTLRGEIADTRVGPEGQRVRLPIPPAYRDRPLRWTVVHQRVAHGSSEPRRAPVAASRVMASGVLETPPG